MPAATCVKCGSSNFAPGNLSMVYPPVAVCVFRLEGDSARSTSVKAAMCLDCGFLELIGDPAAAKAAMKNISSL